MTSGSGIIDTTEVEFRQVESQSLLGKIGKTLFGGGNDGTAVLGANDESQMREMIYKDFKKIIVACLHCWNDLPIFTTRDFNF